jgi:hypothetical protein
MNDLANQKLIQMWKSGSHAEKRLVVQKIQGVDKIREHYKIED